MSSGDQVTAHVIVRDEERWIKYSLMSVAPFVARTIVFIDARSKDATREIVEKVRRKVPTVESQEVTIEKRLLDVPRAQQCEMTVTPFSMVLDGDEVYTRDGIQRLLRWVDYLPKDKNGVRVRCLWFYPDRFHVCAILGPQFPGRLCRTEWRGKKLTCGNGEDEMWHYEGMHYSEMIFVWDKEIDMYHYSRITKRAENLRKRRTAEVISEFTGPQPEVFNDGP